MTPLGSGVKSKPLRVLVRTVDEQDPFRSLNVKFSSRPSN